MSLGISHLVPFVSTLILFISLIYLSLFNCFVVIFYFLLLKIFFDLNFILFIFIQQVLIIYFIHISVYMSIPISQFITPPPPPPTPRFPALVSICLFSTSGSLFLPCKPVHLYNFSRFHIYALIYVTCFSLSDLLHSV